MAIAKKQVVTRNKELPVAQVVQENVEQVVRTVADRPVRKSRKPFGVPRSKLAVANHIEGYHLHWINDTPGRLHEASSGDYEFVSPKEVGVEDKEERIKQLVGTNEDGSPMFAYLMKIRQEWYEEDQKAVNAVQDSIDAQIRGGKLEDTGNRYIPQGGISIK
jgi:hypothetical protein